MSLYPPEDDPVAQQEFSGSLVDCPAAAHVSASHLLWDGFRKYERHEVVLPHGSTAPLQREILRSGPVVGVLPIDLRRSEMVLIRQFRLAGHIALGKGAMIEIPAGRIGPRESPMEAACRECQEETGARPNRLYRLFEIMPAPALSDECMTLYIGSIDAAEVKPHAGCEEENETIETVRVSLDAVGAMLADDGLHNSVLIIALQWLALNRGKLTDLFEMENG